jgi:hypothetical protein
MRLTLIALLLVAAAGCGSAAGRAVSSAPDAPVTGSPITGGGDDRVGGATLVRPRPGGGSTTPVNPIGLRVGGDGDGAWARVTWYGGVAPCSVLRPVTVRRTGTTITLVLREGSDAAPGTACAEIAMKKAVRVSLGQLAAGDYTVVAGTRRATLTV